MVTMELIRQGNIIKWSSWICIDNVIKWSSDVSKYIHILLKLYITKCYSNGVVFTKSSTYYGVICINRFLCLFCFVVFFSYCVPLPPPFLRYFGENILGYLPLYIQYIGSLLDARRC